MTLTRRLAALVIAAILGAIAFMGPQLRRMLIHDVVTFDAVPTEPAALPFGDGAGLSVTPRVRVVLIDGLASEMARTLPAWSALCDRGTRLPVDVGFPTVSLPVEIELWSGLTQQQSGIVFGGDKALDPPLGAHGIPHQVAGSWVLAESHPYIVRSLGFAKTEPPGHDEDRGTQAALDKAWAADFLAHATTAVTSAAPLVFVHVLRVDVAGHNFGGASPEYALAAREADAILAALVAAAPDARWFALSDHGHLATGGHGGEEPSMRQVEACIAGPGVAIAKTGLVHLVDLSRAIADSTGAKLDRESRGRPLAAAIAAPLAPDQALPAEPLRSGALAILVLALGAGLSSWGIRRWWLAPWWLPIAWFSMVAIRGVPTLSMPMVYAPEGRTMYLTWLPALAVAAVATFVGMRRTSIARVLVAQLALPFACTAAVITACGAWPAVFGAEVAPVVVRYTAWMSPVILIVAHGSAAVALAALATAVRPASGRPAPAAQPRTPPAADA